jgi:hypothetical protein
VKLLACGSRTFEDGSIVEAILDGIDSIDSRVQFLIHGAARGADTHAAFWAERQGFPEEAILAFPADWEKYGKRAGYVRNQQMLDEGHPDLVVAFVDKPLAESKGTAMMVDIARKAGVKTITVEVQ